MAANRVIGVDIGGTKFLAGSSTATGTCTETVERPTSRPRRTPCWTRSRRSCGSCRLADVVAVGLGVPARVDQRTGTVLGAVNLPITEVVLAAEMERRLGLPVGVENDANCRRVRRVPPRRRP